MNGFNGLDNFMTFYSGTVFNSENVLLSLLLAFILGQVIAWVYYYTHSGLSYSKSFVQSLILITVVISMVMSAIANSLVTAVGLMGALAIIRFRNMVKDTRDIAFIFFTLVVGMATGAGRYQVAVVGTILLSLIIIYLYWTSFGSHEPHNGFLNFSTSTKADISQVTVVLEKYCITHTLVSAEVNDRELASGYSYQLMIKSAEENHKFISQLEQVKGVKDIQLTMQEQILEV